MTGYDRDGHGNYIWKCPYCDFITIKNTPQGRGLAKSNHMRVHNPILIWQRRHKKVVDWMYDEKNYYETVEECPLIKDFEMLEEDSANNRFKVKYTWIETGETVILDTRQWGQGIPRYRVLEVKEVP